MFFSSWHSLLRIAVVGTLAYVFLIVLLRVMGKRTLSKLSAYDLVVTVALGSTLSSVLLDRNVALLDGIAALALLTGLQLAVAWTVSRWGLAERVVSARATQVFHRGEFLHDMLLRERLTADEVRAAIRQARVPSLNDVESVVLEASGDLSVVLRSKVGAASALHGVDAAERAVRGSPETSAGGPET